MKDLFVTIKNRSSSTHLVKWIIPACFGLSLALTIAAIILAAVRGLDGMQPEWMFSISADIFCMAMCTMLSFSNTLNYKSKNDDTKMFISLLTTIAFALFVDEVCWLVQGIAALRAVNTLANVAFYLMGSVLIYLFWTYIRRALNLRDQAMIVADLFIKVMLVPSLLLCLLNFIYPLYFTVNADGVYQRAAQWDVSQVYLSITLTVVIIAIVFSKAPAKSRFVAITFIAIPLINQVLTSGTFGISTQYAAMAVSVVLIYGVLVAEHEKTLASTEKELDLATRIQASMLPNAFPFMPERTEFDLYASMTPAKEVGGDFYDFFMVDENRLALVIADVSGKGVPAALFMMASKILIKNCMMSESSPAKVLRAVNEQICSNNNEEMFVTVWLGVLDLGDGTLTTANAGHEYPVIKAPDGKFELQITKHSFVVGGMPGIKYKETQISLEPGSKLFVYTDGVPEAENSAGEQYGYERFLSALNSCGGAEPGQLLEAVEADVRKFANDYPQSDDLTMLCVHYRGKNDEKTNG